MVYTIISEHGIFVETYTFVYIRTDKSDDFLIYSWRRSDQSRNRINCFFEKVIPCFYKELSLMGRSRLNKVFSLCNRFSRQIDR